jgi:hypothetical protein
MSCEQSLSTALAEISSAKVVFGNKKFRKHENLFGLDLDIEVVFNGYDSVGGYQDYLENIYHNVRSAFDERIARRGNFMEMLQLLEYSKFDVCEVKRMYFKDDPMIQFRRIKMERTHHVAPEMEDSIKKKLLEFLWVQKSFADDLIAYFEYRARFHREIYTYVTDQNGNLSPAELNGYRKVKLALFPNCGEQPTMLKWNKDKVAFVEMVISLIVSGSLIGVGCKLRDKDVFAFMIWMFNIPVADVYGTLKASKLRKTSDSSFLLELEKALKEYKEKDL